jgi:PTH1 family peptidyl-tRNA hydrolase
MKLIAGLGNPGEKYERTKHNLGFVVLDGLLQDLTEVEKTDWKEDIKI